MVPLFRAVVKFCSTNRLFAQRIVEDHMRGNNLQPQDLEMTHKLMEFVKNARKEYYLDQQPRSQSKIQNENTKQKQALIDQIEEYSRKITVLKGTVLQLNSDADKYSFEAEKKTALLDIKSTLSKSTALKRAVVEKQEELEKIVERKDPFRQETSNLSLRHF